MTMFVFYQPFMIRAFIGGLLVATITALIGVFIVLKKQSFLTDGIAHASLSGIALGLFFHHSPIIWAMLTATIMAAAITFLRQKYQLAFDSLIGIIYAFLFSLGIIIIGLVPNRQAELLSYLFGSILAIGNQDIWQILIIAVVVIGSIKLFFQQLLYSTFDPEGAYLHNIKISHLEYWINVLSAIAVIMAIKLVGVVMVSALIVIPASTAKIIAKNFHQMFFWSLFFSLLSVAGGLLSAYVYNLPSGAAIVVASTLIFFANLIFHR